MSKRSIIVVSSSEDEDKDGSFNSKRGYSKCKSRRKNPSGAKKARISGSRPRLCRDSSVFDEMRLFCEEFGEGLTGFKVLVGVEERSYGLININLDPWRNFLFTRKRLKKLQYGLRKD